MLARRRANRLGPILSGLLCRSHRRSRRVQRAVDPMKPSDRQAANATIRRLIVSGAGALLLAYLVVFHSLLLWQRVLNLSLFEPVPALRWLATLALLVALYRLRRQGVSLVRGRRALVVWFLVLLLHVCFWGPLSDPAVAAERPIPNLLLVLPTAGALTAFVFFFLRKSLGRIRLESGRSDLPNAVPGRDSQSYSLRAGFLPSIACRPPPLA